MTQPRYEIINGDALEVLKGMESESVHCVVTSPPYWGLRNYKVDGMIGLEPQFKDWLDKMVEVCDEIKRVLRSDGTFFCNVGDCYATPKSGYTRGTSTDIKRPRYNEMNIDQIDMVKNLSDGFKPKDLLLMPSRLAIALQESGWYVRSEIIFAKPNPMPESVTDRPTSSHEKIFMLTKSERYFADMERVREGNDVYHRKAGGYKSHSSQMVNDYEPFKGKGGFADSDITTCGRNLRNVWQIATEPNRFAMCPDCHKWYESRPLQCTCGYHGDKWGGHYAAFPKELARRCIKIGTSERGCCPVCGKQWVRVVEKEKAPREVFTKCNTDIEEVYKPRIDGEKLGAGQKYQNWRDEHPPKTIGFSPSCSCGKYSDPSMGGAGKSFKGHKGNFKADGTSINPAKQTIGWDPGCNHERDNMGRPLILDPFAGSGTTGIVALELGCNFTGIELNKDYCNLSEFRLSEIAAQGVLF